MKGWIETQNGQVHFDGEIGDYICELIEENKKLMKEVMELRLHTFDLEFDSKRSSVFSIFKRNKHGEETKSYGTRKSRFN